MIRYSSQVRAGDDTGGPRSGDTSLSLRAGRRQAQRKWSDGCVRPVVMIWAIMRCPKCCGSSQRLLAPGSYECTSQTRVVGQTLVNVVPAGVSGPIPVPIYKPVYGPCGHRYTQKDSLAAQRAAAKQVKTEQQYRAFERECREADQERREAEQQYRTEAIAAWEAKAVITLEAVSNRIERLVRAVSEVRSAQTPELLRLIPASWDDQEVVAWFLGAVSSPATTLRVVEKRPYFGYKEHARPGWCLSVPLAPEEDRCAPCVAVMLDGRVLTISAAASRTYHDGPAFSEEKHQPLLTAHLRKMSVLVGLKPLDLPPRPPMSSASPGASPVRKRRVPVFHDDGSCSWVSKAAGEGEPK
jgi:uncharacterized membrane protein